MKVLFVHHMNYLLSIVPEGIAQLSAILKEHGHEVEIFDTTFMKPEDEKKREKALNMGICFYKKTKYTMDDLAANDPVVDIADAFHKKLGEFKPQLIAISIMTNNYDRTMELIKSAYSVIKESNPSCKIIVGGPHPTLLPDVVIKEEEIDYVCVGEGEWPLLELCDCLDNNKDTSGIKNLYVGLGKRDGRKVFKNCLRPYVDLNELPPIDLSLFDVRHFFKPFLGEIYKGIFLGTSRGCPRGCSFCVNNKYNEIFKDCGIKYLRFQSPEKITQNINYFRKNYGIDFIRFTDDTFLMRPLKDLQSLKDTLKPLNMKFAGAVDPATITEEKISLAKDIGFVSMTLGIETGNENIRRKTLAKQISNAQIKRAVDILRKYNIKVSAFNLIGLPGETVENVFETIRFNKELGVWDANVYPVYPYPGTKMYRDNNISVYRDGKIIPMEEAYEFKMSKLSKGQIIFFLKAFNLFLVLSEDYWDRINALQADFEDYPNLVKIAQEIIDAKGDIYS